MAKRPKNPRGGGGTPKVPDSVSFDGNNRIITINESGEIELRWLYSVIQAWSGSIEGSHHDDPIEVSGNLEFPDRTRSPLIFVMINNWRLAAVDSVQMVGGYLTGRDPDRRFYHPIVEAARDRIDLMPMAADPAGGGKMAA